MELISLRRLPSVLEDLVISYYQGPLAFEALYPSLCIEDTLIVGNYNSHEWCHHRVLTSFQKLVMLLPTKIVRGFESKPIADYQLSTEDYGVTLSSIQSIMNLLELPLHT